MSRPRVGHLTVAPEFVENIMLLDLRRLRKHEDITVICAEGPGLQQVRDEGFRVLTIPANRKISPLADLRTVVALWRLLRRERFDLLHTYAPKAGLVGQLAAALARTPARVHGCRGLLYMPGMSRTRRILFRATDRLTGWLAHRTLFVSEADRALSVDTGLCSPRRALHLGTGIELARFTRTPALDAEGRAWRASLGVPSGARLVLTIGRYVSDKGFREAAAAAALIRDTHPDVRHLWIAPVTAGEEGILPDDLPEREGVADVVTRIGFVRDLCPAFAAADLLLHPSHREGVPRVVMEAAAMGVPILASDIPGVREIVHHERSALLFPPGDVPAIASALGRALDCPAETRARALAAEAEVRMQFDQDALSARVWSVHEQLLARRPGRTALAPVDQAS